VQRNSIFGAIAGGIAGSALGSAGAGSAVVGLAVPVGTLLSTAIMDKLDCKEQVQAAEATTNAVRGGVALRRRKSAPRQCFGDLDSHWQLKLLRCKLRYRHRCCHRRRRETTALKRMCRKPGDSGYHWQQA
jgi:hypothetical protein